MAKATWDTVGATLYRFSDWQATLWQKVEVDSLIEATKALSKEAKALPKAVRSFEVYK